MKTPNDACENSRWSPYFKKLETGSKPVLRWLATLALVLTINHRLSTAFAQGTAFTYQGQLQNGGALANGSYDFRFRLASDPLANNYVSNPFFTNAVPVSGGLFSLVLDFGAGIFTGTNYWLEVDVRTNGASSYAVLTPLQGLTPTPYAVFAENVSGGLAAGTYGNAVTFSNAADQFSGTFIGNGSGLTNLSAVNISSGTLSDGRLSGNVALLNASQTFSGGLNTFGDIALENSSATYHHLELSGGNSLGYLYGSFPAFGDGIHLGYNYYADSSGTSHIPNTGGGTSRISCGYGAIGLYVGGVNANPSSGLIIDGNGLGINNSNPQDSIDLFGTIAYRNNGKLWSAGIDAIGADFGFWTALSGSAVAYIDSSGNYHQSSDRQLKDEVTSLGSALDRLMKLRPVSYRFRSAGSNAPLSLGFIAQELQPLFPEAVGEQTNGFKDMVYSELIPAAVRSIQELNEKVESENAVLRAENADVKARLDKLEQLVKSEKGNSK